MNDRTMSPEVLKAMMEIYKGRCLFRTLALDFIVEFIGESQDIEKAIGEISVEQAFVGLAKAAEDIFNRKLATINDLDKR